MFLIDILSFNMMKDEYFENAIKLKYRNICYLGTRSLMVKFDQGNSFIFVNISGYK